MRLEKTRVYEKLLPANYMQCHVLDCLRNEHPAIKILESHKDYRNCTVLMVSRAFLNEMVLEQHTFKAQLKRAAGNCRTAEAGTFIVAEPLRMDGRVTEQYFDDMQRAFLEPKMRGKSRLCIPHMAEFFTIGDHAPDCSRSDGCVCFRSTKPAAELRGRRLTWSTIHHAVSRRQSDQDQANGWPTAQHSGDVQGPLRYPEGALASMYTHMTAPSDLVDE
jgi:hypothetical protein